MPNERRVTDAIKTTGVPVYTHTCGRIGDRLELMLATGTQGIDTLDPPPLAIRNSDGKARIVGRAFIKGNMNGVELLAMKTEEEVIAHASERLRSANPRRLYSQHRLFRAPQNRTLEIRIAVPVSEAHGGY